MCHNDLVNFRILLKSDIIWKIGERKCSYLKDCNSLYIFQVSLLTVKTIPEECEFYNKNTLICTNEDRTPQFVHDRPAQGQKVLTAFRQSIHGLEEDEFWTKQIWGIAASCRNKHS